MYIFQETHQGYSTDAETTEDETEEPAENKKQKSSKDSKFLEADETKNNLTIPKDESFVLVQNVNEKRSDNKGSQTEGLIKNKSGTEIINNQKRKSETKILNNKKEKSETNITNKQNRIKTNSKEKISGEETGSNSIAEELKRLQQ